MTNNNAQNGAVTPAVTIKVPRQVERFTADHSEISVNARTVRSALDILVSRHERVKGYLFTSSGEIRRFVKIFVNKKSVDVREIEDVNLDNGDVIAILSAISGG